MANTCIREPILIVLDALDECGGPDEHSQSCKLMRDKLSTLPTIYRFAVTSRPEQDVGFLMVSFADILN